MTAIDKGNRCNKLLDDKDLQQAFQDVEDAITLKWKQAPIDDREGQQKLRLSLHLLQSVQANLVEAVKQGTLEAYRLEQEKSGVSYLGDKLWHRNKARQK